LEGIKKPSIRKKEGDSVITYSDFIQTGLFIVALIGLCYQILRESMSQAEMLAFQFGDAREHEFIHA